MNWSVSTDEFLFPKTDRKILSFLLVKMLSFYICLHFYYSIIVCIQIWILKFRLNIITRSICYRQVYILIVISLSCTDETIQYLHLVIHELLCSNIMYTLREEFKNQSARIWLPFEFGAVRNCISTCYLLTDYEFTVNFGYHYTG